ncbi:hypothetical protein E2C01_096515 [Portunus trituberculatus]|uniref:Uncharacterized protein n=1 Tax=Portunus trituberculatus TaxID=210409 RepID=A0A5B7K8F5_PORTR|nr:hypothetical protein [Portunus trituberculatus]
MFTVSQWAAPLLAGSTSSLPASGSAPSPTLHPEALLEGSRSPSPVYSRRSSMLEEDTFTHGGVYIGSLQSHIRVSEAWTLYLIKQPSFLSLFLAEASCQLYDFNR